MWQWPSLSIEACISRRPLSLSSMSYPEESARQIMRSNSGRGCDASRDGICRDGLSDPAELPERSRIGSIGARETTCLKQGSHPEPVRLPGKKRHSLLSLEKQYTPRGD